MSFLDALRRFFKPTPEEKAEKLRKKIVNMYVNADDRKYCLQQLASMGPELAPKRLIERFTCKAENGTVDAEEKEMTRSLLINLGSASVSPLKDFLRHNDMFFSWPYRTLSDLISHDELIEFTVELLETIGPEYVRDTERKEQLILTVRSYTEDSVAHAVLPYLADEDETIRFITADTVIEHGREEGKKALMDRLGVEDSRRIVALIAGAFRDKAWPVDEDKREAVEKNLPSEFRMNSKGVIL